MTKLVRITIDHLKNVEHGVMNFKNKNGYLNVVGIYGQNGSGKTTLIDAMGIYRDLVLGKKLGTGVADYVNETPAQITILFERNQVAFSYQVSLKKHENNVYIVSETIKTFKLPNYTYEKNVFSYDYDFAHNTVQMMPVRGNFRELELPLIAAVKDRESFIFGSVFKEWVKQNQRVKKYRNLIMAYEDLRKVTFNLNIHTEEMNGLLATGNVLPLSFAISQEGRHAGGVLPVSLQAAVGSTSNKIHYTAKQVDLLKVIFAKISNVIEKIVPGMQLVTKFYQQTRADGQGEESRIEILTQREGRLIPLRAESLGVQKLVSVLALLIEVYNNPNQIVLIDELDSGIFEFLLGELVKIMSDGAQGQLIFTSHNLRVLETLPDDKIYFSTDDPRNRYTQIVGTRDSNNLRNIYIREVQLNESGRHLYQKTDTSKIKFAFEDADLAVLKDDKNSYDSYSFGL